MSALYQQYQTLEQQQHHQRVGPSTITSVSGGGLGSWQGGGWSPQQGAMTQQAPGGGFSTGHARERGHGSAASLSQQHTAGLEHLSRMRATTPAAIVQARADQQQYGLMSHRGHAEDHYLASPRYAIAVMVTSTAPVDT